MSISTTITLLLDKDGTIIFSSSNFNDIIGFNVLNKKISEIVCNQTYEEIRKIVLECMFTNKQVLTVNNRIYAILATPILNDNMNIKYIILNSHDISIMKKINEEVEFLKQKLDESNSVKSIFLSNISHELRTPMNAIIGFSDLLLDNNKDHLDRFLKSINSNAKHLDELLNNILDYSKLESNEFDILYENFSINDLFEELDEIFEDVNYKKNLDFVKLEFTKNDDKKIISDYIRLKQVLFNIISNSIKFTESGYIKLSYEIFKDYILFKVEDTGIGIPTDKIKYVFDRFWQYDSSSTKKYKGAGLGLSISKSIVELLNGKIWVESVLNSGTTFFVKIPLEEIKQEVLVENKNKINFSGKTVLVVDELPINYSLLGMYLNSLNVTMLSALSGKAALEIYEKQNQKIELIFIDLNLPDMNGNELTKKLKKIRNDCYIVTKSGILKNIDLNTNYHLKKPIDKEKLILILNKIWQK